MLNIPVGLRVEPTDEGCPDPSSPSKWGKGYLGWKACLATLSDFDHMRDHMSILKLPLTSPKSSDEGSSVRRRAGLSRSVNCKYYIASGGGIISRGFRFTERGRVDNRNLPRSFR